MKYEEAIKYRSRIRNLEPPIYFEERLAELPIPDLGASENNANVVELPEPVIDDGENNTNVVELPAPVIDADGNIELVRAPASTPDGQFVGAMIENENVNQALPSSEVFLVPSNDSSSACMDELAAKVEGASLNDLECSLTTANVPSIKTDTMPIFDVRGSNCDGIMDILSEPESIIDDEVSMTVGSRGFPMPMKATDGGLIKRDKDVVSGDLPYFETVRMEAI